MGKRSREKIEGKKGLIARAKEKVEDKTDQVLNNAYYRAINHPQYLAEWRRISKVTRNEDIDYTIPQIELETKLCDIRNLKLIRKGRHRDEFLATLSPEAQELYLNGRDSAGTKYMELEHPSVLKSFVSQIRAKWKKDFHEEMPKEVEDNLLGRDEDEELSQKG